MRTQQEIEKQIKAIKWCVNSHKKQIDFYLNDDFNSRKIKEYSEKIETLQAEITLLEWVLDETN